MFYYINLTRGWRRILLPVGNNIFSNGFFLAISTKTKINLDLNQSNQIIQAKHNFQKFTLEYIIHFY